MAKPGSSAWREEFWGPGCDARVLKSFYWIIGAGKIQCHKNAIRAFRALGRVFQRHDYHIRSDVTGAYNCRKLTGSATVISAHAQGIAIDVNWDTNPYRTDKLVTDMPKAMIEEVKNLCTTAGVQAIRWGGDWDWRPETPSSNYDAMHFEVVLTPDQMRAGFLVPAFPEDSRLDWPLLALNEKGPAVRQLQSHLNEKEFDVDVDGYFGTLTEAAVMSFQRSRRLTIDGVVGLGTWTSLITDQPEVDAGGISPQKH